MITAQVSHVQKTGQIFSIESWSFKNEILIYNGSWNNPHKNCGSISSPIGRVSMEVIVTS